MTPTEKLIAEARELDRMATPGPWKVDKQGRYCDHDECYVELADDSMTINNFIVEGCRYENAEFIAQSRTLIPALCDALEQAQSTLEQTWEWDMYKAAQKEIERLRKDLAALASELVKRDIALAKLESEIRAAVEAQNAQRWIPVTERLPESGEHVWFCCEIRPSGEQYVCDGYYAAPKSIVVTDDPECASEYDEYADEYFLLEGYYEVIKNWDDFSSIVIDDFVTHWMPLPEPPKEGVEKSDAN